VASLRGGRLAALEPIPSSDINGRDVGRRISQARYEAGWMTQKTLAELLCVCKRSVQAYEAGRTIPYRHLHRLGQIFERPSSWFLYGDQPGDDGSSAVDGDDEIVRRLGAQTSVLEALTVEMREMRRTLNALNSRFAKDAELLS
jgi:DNA-binding XRE family transcriptional regulator